MDIHNYLTRLLSREKAEVTLEKKEEELNGRVKGEVYESTGVKK